MINKAPTFPKNILQKMHFATQEKKRSLLSIKQIKLEWIILNYCLMSNSIENKVDIKMLKLFVLDSVISVFHFSHPASDWGFPLNPSIYVKIILLFKGWDLRFKSRKYFYLNGTAASLSSLSVRSMTRPPNIQFSRK